MAFGITPSISSDGETEIGDAFWQKVYDYRLHPRSALVKNTAVFRGVVEEIGFSCMHYLLGKG
jgi:hypothetical protein